MPTILTNGIQLPDKGSVDWYSSMQSNYNLIDTHLGNTDIHVTAEDKANWDSKQGSLSQAQLDAIAQVSTNTNDIATLQSGKANASHTHSSTDITDIGDYATKQYVDNSISGLVDSAPNALDTLNELAAALNDDANFASTVTTALSAKANSADLATVATSGSYNDLSNKPTINDSTITIQKNGSLVGTFTVNGSAKIIDIPVPTKTSDLINDSNFVDTSNSAVASGITSAKVTDYDTHIANTNIHVTTADKTKWNNGVSQSYVLRYSSSSVTDNSTIAYSTLDNIDNIKLGDKVIDVDGKIFSIVSVDTANQTVTVGSALIDLALDANVVHTSGDETITGTKTLDNVNLPFKNSAELGVSGGSTNITFSDKNGQQLCALKANVYSSGVPSLYFTVTQKVDNTIYTTNGISVYQQPNSKVLYLRPTLSNNNADGLSVWLGNTTSKFSRIYGLLYYYGSDNVEFSTKFVTTDTNQTISGVKTFSSSPVIYNSDTTASIPQITLKNQKVVKSSTTETGAQLIYFTDKNNNALGQIETRVVSNGTTGINITSFGLDSNNQNISSGVQILRSPTTANFAPNADNAVTCGRSSAKWSDVQTYQINGLTPSSLSLPSTRDNAIDISSYFTNFNNGGTNQYSPTVNGWIYLETTGCNALHCFCTTTGNLVHYGNTVARANDGMAYVTFPVLANTLFKCTWYSNSTITLSRARFIPCQGNI